jgi:hypothetical protein
MTKRRFARFATGVPQNFGFDDRAPCQRRQQAELAVDRLRQDRAAVGTRVRLNERGDHEAIDVRGAR